MYEVLLNKKKVNCRNFDICQRMQLNKRFKYLLASNKFWSSFGVHFIKHDIQDVFLKCAQILPARL
jgi:hypothetical protein